MKIVAVAWEPKPLALTYRLGIMPVFIGFSYKAHTCVKIETL